jgi:hypothetical protein
VWDTFRQSTESRPASIALIVQRRAAIQNCCLCPVQQNFRIDSPVIRGVKVRWHHRQCGATGGSGAGSSSSTLVTDPLLWAAATTASFAGRSADLTPTVIKVLGAFSRGAKLFGIEVLCKFKWAVQYSNHSVNQIPSVLNDEYSSRPP